MEEEAKTNTKKHHGIRLSWWLIVLAIVAFGGALTTVILSKNNAPKVAVNQNKKPDTADEIKIQQAISSMRGDVVRYFETQKTYVGWVPANTNATKIKTLGSELKTNLTATSYMMYAKLPTSKLYFCMDQKFTGQLTKVGKNSCQ